MTRPKALFLLGPTASGKTALALALADRFPVDLVSVDSALVYRGMDIGTAKPDAATLEKYPHRLIDLIDPDEAYSAARFAADARSAMEDIVARGRIPLLVGGTMLYAKALTEGLSALPQADAAVRASIEARAADAGWPAMHAELAMVDPVTAARLKPNDAQRIQRALEVHAITGQPLSQLQDRRPGDEAFPYEALMIGLVPSERALLHERIAVRFDQMLDAGLVQELTGLRARHALSSTMPSMRCVGYRQAWEFLDGRIDRRALREQGVAATRQLAKRQLTWLRAMPRVQSVDCLRGDLAAAVAARVDAFLSA